MNTKIQWLVGLVTVLIIANVALLASIWLKKDDRTSHFPDRGDARNYLVEKLALTKEQAARFDSLRVSHFKRIEQYRDEMRELKDNLFAQLKAPEKGKPDSIAQNIGTLQSKIDLETFDHFSQLRQLLDADQAKTFDNTIQEVLRTMAPKGGPEGRLPRPPLGAPPGSPEDPTDGPPR